MITQESDRGHDTTSKTEGAVHYRFEPKTVHRPASYDRGVQVAAARLRIVTDRKLGLETPDWIKELAAEKSRNLAS
tara:strand:+ start:523 stop:750 length:228 start_codon:yes stop_codon:yes gene_type:complete